MILRISSEIAFSAKGMTLSIYMRNLDKESTMTTIQIQSTLPFDTLLESLEQLSAEELADLTQHSARLHAQRKASSLSEAEAELLIKINSGIVPPQIQARCATLTDKQHNSFLTSQEQDELAALIDEIEELNARRTGYILQLANLREVSLNELMQSLELKPLSYG
jgi:hypothetical protein